MGIIAFLHRLHQMADILRVSAICYIAYNCSFKRFFVASEDELLREIIGIKYNTIYNIKRYSNVKLK